MRPRRRMQGPRTTGTAADESVRFRSRTRSAALFDSGATTEGGAGAPPWWGCDPGGGCKARGLQARRQMNLCDFEVGLDRPLFLIAGRRRRAEQGPHLGGDATPEADARPAD